VAVVNALFLTYGLRGEWSPSFGPAVNPNLARNYGVALAHEFGPVTAKLRGKYGRSTRPPSNGKASGQLYSEARPGAPLYWGNVYTTLPTPDLLPEHRQGGEGGVELYLGNRASFTVTRANETVDNLIDNAKSDSVDILPQWTVAFPVCAVAWKCPLRQNQNLNLGSIRNQSWEFHGTVTLGPVTTSGTWTHTKSRIIGITERYRNQFPYYYVGGSFIFSPEHTYGVNVTYARGNTTISTNWQGQGTQLLGTYDLFALTNDRIRLDVNNKIRWNIPATYAAVGSGYGIGDVHVSQRVTAHVDANIDVSNLASTRRVDDAATAGSVGRGINIGMRIRL
jgi:hypothetical protein